MTKRILTLIIFIQIIGLSIAHSHEKHNSTTIINTLHINNLNLEIEANKKESKKITNLISYIEAIIKNVDKNYAVENDMSFTNKLNLNHEVIARKEFINLFQKAYEISNNTKGAYNPTDYTYEQYWASHKLIQASKKDSIALDTLYKYNVFSGFVSGDSVYGKDTFHLLFLEDFIFKVSFNNLLPGVKLQEVISFLNYMHLKSYKLKLTDQVYFANTYFNGKYEMSYDVEKPTEFGLKYMQNFQFTKNQYLLLKQSREVRIWTDDAVKACAYATAFCNTKLNNNHEYWRGLIHFETEFK
jgi:hypothetical protein